MKIRGLLTCDPSIEIVKLPYVVVKVAGKKVENSAFGSQCLPPLLSPPYPLFPKVGCHRELFFMWF